jgi:hypothetical protein
MTLIAELSLAEGKGPSNFRSMTHWLQMLLKGDSNLFNPEEENSPRSSLEFTWLGREVDETA